MKTTFLTSVVLFMAVVFMSQANAQEKPSKYYFAWAYSYKTSEPVMLITKVKLSNCPGTYGYGISETDVALQWHDYVKSEYKDYFKFTKEENVRDTEYEAQKRRREVMGNWTHKIIKIEDFKVYCKD